MNWSVGGLSISNDPIRRKEGARRETIAPFSGPYSRRTLSSGRRTSERERDVGMDVDGKADACSLARNSRIDERRTARPSAWREKGVRPEPLSWISWISPEGRAVSTVEGGGRDGQKTVELTAEDTKGLTERDRSSISELQSGEGSRCGQRKVWWRTLREKLVERAQRTWLAHWPNCLPP